MTGQSKEVFSAAEANIRLYLGRKIPPHNV